MIKTLKMRELVEFSKAGLEDRKFTPKMNLAIAVNRAAAEPFLKGHNKNYAQLLEDSFERDEDGNPVYYEADGMTHYKLKDSDEFERKCEELLEETVEVTVREVEEEEIHKCTAENACDVPTAAQLTAILFMIEI